jgi:uncharacterized glyoxalase superfamily protein PhnB
VSLSVSKVSIYVDDQDGALDFWTTKVGCTVVTDLPYGEGRWIEVRPPAGGADLVIYKATPEWPDHVKGTLNYVLFDSEDINKAYDELSARGVEFTAPPQQESWGWSAVFKDNEGHLFHLGQR